MQRRKLLKGIAALAIAERLGMLRAAWAAGGKLPPPGVYKIKGEVRVNGQLAKEGTPVKPGDTITTGAQSEAIYIIGNDAYLQRDRSTVSIAGDTLKAGLRVLSGKLLSVFGRGEKRIETNTATIGIRGTGCYIEAEEKRVYFCLCYGVAELTSPKMPGIVERLETAHHDSPVYLHDDGSKMMVPAMMMNHSDAELILLESLVGRLPPFYGQGFSSY
jgi:hypothetical protein